MSLANYPLLQRQSSGSSVVRTSDHYSDEDQVSSPGWTSLLFVIACMSGHTLCLWLIVSQNWSEQACCITATSFPGACHTDASNLIIGAICWPRS